MAGTMPTNRARLPRTLLPGGAVVGGIAKAGRDYVSLARQTNYAAQLI
jgi:hypothetical protein